MVDAVFNQADLNKDQRLDFNEFRNLIAQSLGAGSANNFAGSATGANQYSSSSYETSSHAAYGETNAANGSFGSSAVIGGASLNEAGNVGCEASYSSYERASFTPTSGIDVNGFDVNTSGGVGGYDASSSTSYAAGGLETSSASAVGYSGETAGASASTFETTGSQNQLQINGANGQNLYQDPNPQIIRRPAQGGPVTYTQNVKIRFLQPPPIAPPGPLIIKEVRPPQPPPPPPLRVRQQAPPPPQPPPLILREKPPAPPANMGAQTVVRRLPAIPVPPRSVIIERLPALPPKPRDIIIERWVPYTSSAKRKTIVQRAEAPKEYPKPRNIIIQYEPVQVRVVRQFQRLGVTQENPQAYVQRYGSSLLEAQTLVQQARAAGVVEDISPPKTGPSLTGSSTSLNAEYNSASSAVGATSGIDLASGTADLTSGGVDLTAGVEHSNGSADFSASGAEFSGEGIDYGTAGVDFSATGDIGTAASPAHSLNRSRSGSQHRNASFSAFDATQGSTIGGNGYGATASFERTSFASQGARMQSPGADFVGASASGYESYSSATGGVTLGDNDPATIAFNEADLNKDGTLDPNEFRQFLSAQFQNRT
ncbi:unnamed protein product [Adineta ricciae]|uniref:EF-hand domain-containing protein n=1 Tax=Adineta ricciae TaxID=249248 RepID=A0A816F3L9_ADIRI|nr:unnamed protein product [Adineta ricciae]